MGLKVIGGRRISVEEFAEQSDGASQASYTFSGVTLTKAGLLVVRFLVGGVFNADRTAGSITVGGNAAAIVAQGASGVGGTLNSSAAGLAAIPLGAGASGDIVVGISGGLNAAAVAIHPMAVQGLASATPHATGSNGAASGTSISTTLDIPSGGIQVVSAGSLEGAETHTPTGWTDGPAGGSQIDTSWRFHRGWDLGLAAETGRTLTSASADGTNSRRSIAAASFR